MPASPSSRRASTTTLKTVSEGQTLSMNDEGESSSFDILAEYRSLLSGDDNLPMPVAAIRSLCSLIAHSPSITTTSELLILIHTASASLAAHSFNPISLNCGTQLFLRFLTLQRPGKSFDQFKEDIIQRGLEFVRGSGRCREAIAENMAEFIKDGSVLMVHGYSRVVCHALVYAAVTQKKRIQVYVTESRPFGLGLKTHAVLSEASIECLVILDSAVSYTMRKVDLVLCGAEAVCESGGLINYIGGFQLAIAAKACGKPLYALAESYKFTRLFPLSQYDLPTSLSSPPLCFSTSQAAPTRSPIPPTPSRPMIDSPLPKALEMTDEMTGGNPTLDYTTPDLVSLIVSDLGVMTPSGVSDSLLAVYGGE